MYRQKEKRFCRWHSNLRTRATYTTSALAVAVFCGFLGSATAEEKSIDQEDSLKRLSSVTVTARKTEESLQDVPQSVTALTATDLKDRGITNLEGLQFQIPNFNLGQQLGVARISLRGVGLENLAAGAEGSIAFHSDGVFYSRPAAALSAFFDIGRVEVLRGPQGTLYGRNATGGSVNVISAKPTESFEGYADLTIGNYGLLSVESAVSGPISDRVSGRLSFAATERDGYGKNVTTGNEIDDRSSYSIRGQLVFDVSSSTDVLTRLEYHKEDDNNYGYHFIDNYSDGQGTDILGFGFLFGGEAASDIRDVANEADPTNERDFFTASMEINSKFSDSLSVKSITAYQDGFYRTSADLDATSFNLAVLVQQEDSRQFSQEFQLNYRGQNWNLLAGLYYFDEEIDGFIDIPVNVALFGGPNLVTEAFFGGGIVESQAAAAFGEFNYDLSDQWSVTLGARYSVEEKQATEFARLDFATPDDPSGIRPTIPAAMPKDSWDAFTPKIGVQYQPNEETLVFASISRGFKAGGINIGGLQDPFEPETVTSYEVGLKTDLIEDLLRTNLVGFHYDYKDLQVGRVVGNILTIENAASASISGLELEAFAAPIEGLELDFTASYLKAQFDEFLTGDQSRPGQGNTIDPISGQPAFQLSGNALSQAPEFTINAGATIDFPTNFGGFSLRGEVFWVDDIFYSPFNLPVVGQKSHSRQNLFATWTSPSDAISVQAFIKNIDGDDDVSNAFVSSSLVGSVVNGFLEEPKTYGIRTSFRF